MLQEVNTEVLNFQLTHQVPDIFPQGKVMHLQMCVPSVHYTLQQMQQLSKYICKTVTFMYTDVYIMLPN